MARLLSHRLSILLLYTASLSLLIVIFWPTVRVKIRDLGYLTRPLWDSPGNQPEKIIPHFYSSTMNTTDLCSLHENWTPRTKPVKIIDAFIFSIEVDMLEIRMRELWDVVDVFLILESNGTFSGEKKPLVLKQILESPTHNRYAFAKNKIVHKVFVDSKVLESGQTGFTNEFAMRSHMQILVQSIPNIEEGDLIIISDVDEIPSKKAIQLLKSCEGYPSGLHLQTKNYLYSFEFMIGTTNWKPHVVIYSKNKFAYNHGKNSDMVLADAGWHCSFCFRTISEFIFKVSKETRQII